MPDWEVWHLERPLKLNLPPQLIITPIYPSAVYGILDYAWQRPTFLYAFVRASCIYVLLVVVKATRATRVEETYREKNAALVEEARKAEEERNLREAEEQEMHRSRTAEEKKKEEMAINLSRLELGELTLVRVVV